MRVFVEDWQHECCGDAFAVGDVVAWTVDPAPVADETLGELGVEAIEDRHAMAEGPVRKVRGRVARVEVVEQEYRCGPTRNGWWPVPGRFRLREVERAPDDFTHRYPAHFGPGDTSWFETGMVVDLALTD